MLSVWHASAPRATVVFLSGTMVHPLFYREFLDGLCDEGFTVVGVHGQGHGRSPRTKAPLTWDALVRNAADAAAYAGDLGSGPVVVVGSSQGGMLAMALAAAGTPLAGVIAHNILDPADASALRVTRLPAPLARYHHPLRWLLRRADRLLPRLPVPIGVYLDPGRIFGEAASRERFRSDPLALRSYPLGFLAGMLTADLSGMADGSIRCPVVVVAARGDPLFPTADARRLFDHIVALDKRFVELDLDRHLILNECVPQVLPVISVEIGRLAELISAA